MEKTSDLDFDWNDSYSVFYNYDDSCDVSTDLNLGQQRK